MSNAKGSKKLAMKFLIFPTPVRLHTLNFCVKELFYVSLELGKDLLCFSAIMHEVNPRELTEIINETDVVFITTNRGWGPQTSEKMSSNGLVE
jgi:hypothetical protein